jgi:hypothetical protein
MADQRDDAWDAKPADEEFYPQPDPDVPNTEDVAISRDAPEGNDRIPGTDHPLDERAGPYRTEGGPGRPS